MRRLAALTVALLLSVSGAASAATPPASTGATTATAGASEATVDLGGVVLADLLDQSLGTATAQATTAGQTPASLARAALAGGREITLSSADGGQVPAQQVDLAGLGSVRLGGLVADADDTSATAAVEALRAQLAPLGLQLGSQVGQFVASADAEETIARNAIELSGLSVSLSDLLGEELLAQLPLSVLLDLGGLLNLDLGGLGAGDLDALIEQLDAGRALAGQVDAARAAVTSAQAAVTAAEQQLAQAQAQATAAAAAVDAQQQVVTNLQNQIGGVACTLVPALCTQLEAAQTELARLQAQAASAQQAVTTATSALATARAALGPAQDALNALIAQVDGLLDTLTELLAALDGLDLDALLDRLREGLDGVELLGVDAIALTVSSVAAERTSAATAGCRVEGVRVAGQAVDVETCDALSGVLDDLTTEILALLEVLPIAAGQLEVPGVVTLTAPAVSVTEPDAARDGAQIAEARASGLGLQVAALDLADLASVDLLTPVTSFVEDALPDLAALPGVDTAALEAALDALVAQVSALPVGDLTGLSTPELALRPAAVLAASEFGTAVTGPGVTPDGGGTGTPGTPTGETPTLPATGGGIGVALLALAGGLGTARWLRRSRD